MKNETPIETARRLSKRAEQDRCSICGRKLQIEKHHVAGRRHDPDLTTPLCLSCHAQVTEGLRRADVDMRYTPDRVERVRRAMKAAAVFLRMLAEALWRWAESLGGEDLTARRAEQRFRGTTPNVEQKCR
jgi:CRISPR/Cas system-associated protein Cas10 (large subunit of type III CRISPR-Cas system)